MQARITSLFAFLLLATAVQSKDCTPLEAKAAEEEVDTLDTWSSLHRAFVKFGHCDDGAIAEGYSDDVAKLLARQWNRLGDLTKIITTDHRFEEFVLRHLDETVNLDDLNAILTLARDNCPKANTKLCQAIASKIGHITRDAT